MINEKRMKLIVSDYNSGEVDWVVEAPLIVVFKVSKNGPNYLRFKAYVHIFDAKYSRHVGTLHIDYGSKWELESDVK